MGQRRECITSNQNWDSRLSITERLSRWWRRSSFGHGYSERAATAVRLADDAAQNREAAAAAIRQTVRYQAVHELLREGRSVRQIAAVLGLSKSQVGRMARELMPDGTLTDQIRVGLGLSRATEDDVMQVVLDAWGLQDLESAIAPTENGDGPPQVGA